jgi:hypothetical protein
MLAPFLSSCHFLIRTHPLASRASPRYNFKHALRVRIPLRSRFSVKWVKAIMNNISTGGEP